MARDVRARYWQKGLRRALLQDISRDSVVMSPLVAKHERTA